MSGQVRGGARCRYEVRVWLGWMLRVEVGYSVVCDVEVVEGVECGKGDFPGLSVAVFVELEGVGVLIGCYGDGAGCEGDDVSCFA